MNSATIAIAFVYLTTSAIAFLTLGLDKRRARRGEWRVPESTLHALELLGGWPGSFFGQRVHRHKTRKASYQVVFWLIAALHVAGWTWWLTRA